jgi:hypothetical protein
MNDKRKVVHVIAFAVVGILAIAAFSARPITTDEVIVASNPQDATFIIKDTEVTLKGGESFIVVDKDPAMQITTRVFGEEVTGDLDEDGFLDMVYILEHTRGDEKTEYYVAAVMRADNVYLATNVIPLGEGALPQSVELVNGVIRANFAESGATPDSAAEAKTKYVIYEEGQLFEIEDIAEGEMVMQGYYIMGHEVRSFQPCGSDVEFWLMGDSPAYQEMLNVYNLQTVGEHPYIPLFVALVGKIEGVPEDGFGADYEQGMRVSQVVRYPLVSSCRPEAIVVKDPRAATIIQSPLQISGYAKGEWFFEGDFPVILKDSNGTTIAEHYVTAMDDWMTDDFVRFEGMLEFESPEEEKGSVILKKDNPSGLPENNDAVEIPIWFR